MVSKESSLSRTSSLALLMFVFTMLLLIWLHLGTIGLEIALIVCGIGAGDEVIVPAYTFIATASSVLKANAVPVFADISKETLCISPESIKKLITTASLIKG